MCLLTYFEPGVQPDTGALLNGAALNSDGHGYAIVHDGQITVRKGLSGAAMVEAFAGDRARHPEGPALFHSRMATHGAEDKGNCHPFYVDGDRRTVIAHNGILPKDVQPRNGDRRSDTAILAAGMAGRFGSLRKPQVRAAVKLWMGGYNKIVILSVNRRFGGNAFILNEEAGIWTPEGIWYSNDGYRLTGDRWSYSYYGDGWTKDSDGNWTFDADTQTTVIGSRKPSAANELCWMCSGGPDDCTCFDRWSINRLPKLEGDGACYTCQNPRRGCTCVTSDGQAMRCPHCYYQLTQQSRLASMCDVCRTCLECGWPEAECDCYSPASLVKANEAASAVGSDDWHALGWAASS